MRGERTKQEDQLVLLLFLFYFLLSIIFLHFHTKNFRSISQHFASFFIRTKKNCAIFMQITIIILSLSNDILRLYTS